MIRTNISVIISVLIALVLAENVPAQSYDQEFALANKAYLDGNYSEAMQGYQNILASGIVSGEVYFNLGNTYYKLQQYGQAIYCYEVAKKYISGDESLEQNLQLARIHTIDKIEPVPQLFLKSWWLTVLDLFSMEIYAWATLFAFMVLIIVASIRILLNRTLTKTTWIAAVLFMALMIIFISKAYLFETTEFGIILSAEVSVASEPNESGAEIFILHEGTKIELLRYLGDWLEIRIADGKTGWIRNNHINII